MPARAEKFMDFNREDYINWCTSQGDLALMERCKTDYSIRRLFMLRKFHEFQEQNYAKNAEVDF